MCHDEAAKHTNALSTLLSSVEHADYVPHWDVLVCMCRCLIVCRAISQLDPSIRTCRLGRCSSSASG